MSGSQKNSNTTKFNKITDLKYVDADTREVIETVKMSEFYEKDNKTGKIYLLRSYQLDKKKD